MIWRGGASVQVQARAVVYAMSVAAQGAAARTNLDGDHGRRRGCLLEILADFSFAAVVFAFGSRCWPVAVTVAAGACGWARTKGDSIERRIAAFIYMDTTYWAASGGSKGLVLRFGVEVKVEVVGVESSLVWELEYQYLLRYASEMKYYFIWAAGLSRSAQPLTGSVIFNF
ncbi:hypothetical protein B0H16DRAFT_1698294 [Mycena metata]|uniref:Uncharacterized protein n=1 Tax=Mycena metata TaxID=1033252 RepID=A0AAD7HQ10_9AGAR|nr:hypothetical protein B0H16DRAFT_1698294 [Mycena metata]